MIFLCGIPSEHSLGKVIHEVRQLGCNAVVFNQRHFDKIELTFEISNGQLSGLMHLEGQCYRLEDFTGIYTRLMDFTLLPELEKELPGSPLLRYAVSLQDTLVRWFEIAPIRVLNRNAEIGSNFSKPYQAQLIMQQGFMVPETLVTNVPDLVYAFRKKHGKIIYKSISSTRSIVQTLEEKDLGRLSNIRWCPTQFQQFVPGVNVRVHTVGNQAFATSITTGAVDYRYAYLQGEREEIRSVELSDDLTEKCIQLSRSLGLDFAGIDLKITPDDQVYCLEVNPCPAFGYYEHYTGQPIAQAVAKYLSGTQ